MSWNRGFIGIPINFWPFHRPLWKYVLPSLQMNVWVRLWREICRELNRNSETYEKQNRENTRQTKNNHTHKIVFTWFGNLSTSTELQGFHYYQGKKIQSAVVQFFLSLSKTTTTNPNHQSCVFYILRMGFYILHFLHPPPHWLSLRKTPIKNYATLFESSQVVNQIKHS